MFESDFSISLVNGGALEVCHNIIHLFIKEKNVELKKKNSVDTVVCLLMIRKKILMYIIAWIYIIFTQSCDKCKSKDDKHVFIYNKVPHF